MKFCQNCGKKIPSNATFCSYCGAKQTQQNEQQQTMHRVQPQRKNTLSTNHHLHIGKTLVVVIIIIIVAFCGLGYHHHEHGLDNANLTTTLHSHDWNLTNGHKKVGNATFDGNNSMIIDHQTTLPINVHNDSITMVNQAGHENMKLVQRNGHDYIFKPVGGDLDGHKINVHSHYMTIGKEYVGFVGKNGIRFHGRTYHDPSMRYAFHEWGLTQK